MHPRIDEASVNSSVWRACSGFRKGVMSTFGWIQLRIVEAVWAPAVPNAIPRIEARRATVVAYARIRVKTRCFLAPRALSVASS